MARGVTEVSREPHLAAREPSRAPRTTALAMATAAVRWTGRGLSRAGLLALTAMGCVGIQGEKVEAPPAAVAPVKPVLPPPGAARTDRVVLLVADGVRWQEVFFGVDPLLAAQAGLAAEEVVGPVELTPNLHALASRGVALGGPNGAPVLANGPNFVSLPGYTEILTGRVAACHENDCKAHGLPTLLDDFAAAPPGTSGASSVAAVTSWDVLLRAAARDGSSMAISTGRTGGRNLERFATDELGAMHLANGARVAPWPGHGEYRPDRATAEIALHHLRTARPRFLFVSLGDTDEMAHDGDYRGYLAALRQLDASLGRIVAEVGSWGEEGRHVTIAVTTDHGRCASFSNHGRQCPESARTFFVAGGGAVPRLGAVDLEEPVHLRDLAPTLRALAGVAPAASPRPADGDASDDGAGLAIAELLTPVRQTSVAAAR
jgi:hypothetical protein